VLTPSADGDCPVEELEAQHAGASRFYPSFRYCKKPSTTERNVGLEHLPRVAKRQPGKSEMTAPMANIHPTVKPLALMRWLVRLVTPSGGTVLDPFAGSGTTLVATMLEGAYAVGIEMTSDYLPLIEGRMAWASGESELVSTDPIAS
jgi:DNA modification methylase